MQVMQQVAITINSTNFIVASNTIITITTIIMHHLTNITNTIAFNTASIITNTSNATRADTCHTAGEKG